MSIEPRSARMESGGAAPTAVCPVTLMLLPAPVARMVILPPGPGAAASSNERSWPVLLTLMATPVAAPLCKLMLPPDLLRRRGGGTEPAVVSAEETCTREFTLTAPPVVFRLTVPPLPLASCDDGCRPEVASIFEFTLMFPVVFTLSVPPLPAVTTELLAPPFNVIAP